MDIIILVCVEVLCHWTKVGGLVLFLQEEAVLVLDNKECVVVQCLWRCLRGTSEGALCQLSKDQHSNSSSNSSNKFNISQCIIDMKDEISCKL